MQDPTRMDMLQSLEPAMDNGLVRQSCYNGTSGNRELSSSLIFSHLNTKHQSCLE